MRKLIISDGKRDQPPGQNPRESNSSILDLEIRMATQCEPSDSEVSRLAIKETGYSMILRCFNSSEANTPKNRGTNFRIDEQRSLFKWHLCKINTIWVSNKRQHNQLSLIDQFVIMIVK